MVVAILDSSLKSGHHTPPEIFVTGGRLWISLKLDIRLQQMGPL
jgi:hypothetical protein